jgi:DNA-binding transcriptional LysR family regulator
MDLGYYRNFIAIVEAGSISKAAAKVHIAQPALSAQLEKHGKRIRDEINRSK